MVNTVTFSQFAQMNLNNTTNTLVGVTSPVGGSNFQTAFTTAWTTAGRPVAPYVGLQGYNIALNVPEYWDGIAWVGLSGGGGSVTQVNTGTGLVGGPITTTGTVSFAPIAAHSLWANTTGSVAVPTVTALTTFLLSANNLDDLTNAATARINLFLSGSVGAAGQILMSNGVALPASWVDIPDSGFVNPGTINELAWYQVTGNAVSPLPTIPNGILSTDGGGAPAISTMSTILTLLGFNFSLVSPGYYQLPGGLIAQWGVTGLLAHNTSATVTLPISFPTAPFIVLTSPEVSAGTEDGQSSSGTAISASQITISNTGTGISFAVFWFALGH